MALPQKRQSKHQNILQVESHKWQGICTRHPTAHLLGVFVPWQPCALCQVIILITKLTGYKKVRWWKPIKEREHFGQLMTG